MNSAKEALAPIKASLQTQLPEDARMEAYYYGFERTGVGFVDAILSAVAVAGKGSHHTQSWGETEDEFGYYKNRPGLPDADGAADLIQKTADASAKVATDITRLIAAVEAVEAVAADLQQRGVRIEEKGSNGSIYATRAEGRGYGYREAADLVRAALSEALGGDGQ